MEIDITSEKKRFSTFLKEQDNKNIVFSGIFGIGKTYFLRKFFHDNPQYKTAYISPINYSISKNEDILEYIKFDIIFELSKMGIAFSKLDCSSSLALQLYIQNYFNDLAETLLKMGEKLCFKTDILKTIFDLIKELEKYKDSISINEEKEFTEFLNHYSVKTGSIYEDNAITQLIREMIQSLKEDKKESVLIIDDLDRIDPEHIFRILNILSAHDNFHGTNEHKFGFDKIIIVCDMDNIRNIYKSKYGIDVDFNGYIDKFYSKEIYNFDNIENIIKNISDLLASTVCSSDNFIGNKSYPSSIACQSVLSALVKNGSLNTRTLLKYEQKSIENRRIIRKPNKTIYASDIPIIAIFDFITSMYGSIVATEFLLSKLNHSSFSTNSWQYILDIFIILADYDKNKLNKGDYTYNGIEYNINDERGVMYFLTTTSIKPSININIETVIQNAYSNYKQYFI